LNQKACVQHWLALWLWRLTLCSFAPKLLILILNLILFYKPAGYSTKPAKARPSQIKTHHRLYVSFVKAHFSTKTTTTHGSDNGQQSTSMGKENQENTVAPCFGISFLDAEFLSLSYVVG
jgi:hypothetical protein